MNAVVFLYPMFPTMPHFPFADFFVLKDFLFALGTSNDDHLLTSDFLSEVFFIFLFKMKCYGNFKYFPSFLLL